MSRREDFLDLLSKHGYKSINNFCIENKVTQTNLNKRVSNEAIKVDLPTLFNLANLLHEPIDSLIKVFYPEEFAENQECIKK